MNPSIALSKIVLNEVLADIKANVPNVSLRAAWVWKSGKDHWEFHYKDFYWHGSADSAYEARANGWAAYLGKLGVNGYARD